MIQRIPVRKTGWVCQSCNKRLRLFSTDASWPGPIESERSPEVRQHMYRKQAFNVHQPARTRFAPSPTGKLHLGSLRTALYNYLLAKRTGGQFILRIEDTDQKRTIGGAEAQLMRDLHRYGLNWDEGPDPRHDGQSRGPYGPYRQSLRNEIYRKHADKITQSGHAYRCFCSAYRLDQLARWRNDKGLPLGYDRNCISLSADESASRATREPYVVRLKSPQQYPPFYDLTYGKSAHRPKKTIELRGEEAFDDPILLKSDGHPTYHFANVVDDRLMHITHVIRGSEWMSSTPLHVALYEAFGWQPPVFCHVPLMVDESGQKLSKREKSSDLTTYEGPDGFRPEVLLNFIVLLGWSHKDKGDFMTLKEMEHRFWPKFTRGNVVLSFKKLHYLQRMHTQRIIEDASDNYEEFQSLADDVHREVLNQFPAREVSDTALPPLISALLRSNPKGFSKFPISSMSAAIRNFVTRHEYFFTSPTTSALSPYTPLRADRAMSHIYTTALVLCLTPESFWNAQSLHAAIDALAPPLDAPDPNVSDSPNARPAEYTHDERVRSFRSELFRWLRWALLGEASGPHMPQTMELLGREKSCQRIKDAIETSKVRQQVKSWQAHGQT